MGGTLNDLRNQRDLALQRLAERVDIKVRENARAPSRCRSTGSSGGARSINPMRVETTGDGRSPCRSRVACASSSRAAESSPASPSSRFAESVGTNIDQYARAIVLGMNRAHTTGVPLDGGFTHAQLQPRPRRGRW